MATKAKARRVASLQLFEFTDPEFLAVIRDNGDNEGWVSTAELADSIGLRGEDRNRNCGSRLSWMRRFGCVERDLQPGSPTKGSWRLTEIGEILINSQMKAAQLRALSDLDDGQLWDASRLLLDLYQQTGDEAAQLIRRSFRVGLHRRGF